MGLFWSKRDPLQLRARALNTQIEALEAQIRDLASPRNNPRTEPKIRFTAATQSAPANRPGTGFSQKPSDPIFEQVNHGRVQQTEAQDSSAAHYNELGVRKYDLLAAWTRLADLFRGPPAGNPKLISYLAAGNIQGLRPLRYEKRVARNRLLLLAAVLFFVLWGIGYSFMRL